MRASSLTLPSIEPFSGVSVITALVATRTLAGSASAVACGSAVNSRVLAISFNATSSCVMITRAPTLVMPHSRFANAGGRRMQPCEAGWPLGCKEPAVVGNGGRAGQARQSGACDERLPAADARFSVDASNHNSLDQHPGAFFVARAFPHVKSFEHAGSTSSDGVAPR